MMSASACKIGWIGPSTMKKLPILSGRLARSFSDSAGQKPAGVSACGAADDCSCVCAGGALPRSGSSASSGKGGRSSSNASPPLALGALFTSTPEASCSSTREMRASSACASSRKDGSHSCIRSSSAATRTSVFLPNETRVFCVSVSTRISSPGEKTDCSASACCSVAMPESMESPLFGAVRSTSRSRQSAHISPSSALTSLPAE